MDITGGGFYPKNIARDRLRTISFMTLLGKNVIVQRPLPLDGGGFGVSPSVLPSALRLRLEESNSGLQRALRQ